MTDCEKFGMDCGCREDCPVFIRGECEFQEENEKEFAEQDKLRKDYDAIKESLKQHPEWRKGKANETIKTYMYVI